MTAMLLWWITCLLSLLSLFSVIYARSTGAPVGDYPLLCDTMTPGHGGLPSQSTPSPYFISLSSEFYGQQSDTLTVTIDKVQQTDPGLKGILLQARRAVSQEIIGSWSVSDSSNFKTVSCGGGQNTAVTHANADVKVLPSTFIWTPPSDRGSDIYITATFVQSFLSFWVNITSPIIRAVRSNSCDPNPCLSGGTCVPEGNTFSCICPPPFAGPTCHYIVFPCDSNPCANNGICQDVNDDTDFACMCENGFTGRTCEEVFPCDSNPCANNGSCEDVDDTEFVCMCKDGYTGTQCEQARLHIPFDLCLNNKCQNGASCEANYMYDRYTYTCTCAEGFTGTFCETRKRGTNELIPRLFNFWPTGEGDKLVYNIYLVFVMLLVANVVALFIN